MEPRNHPENLEIFKHFAQEIHLYRYDILFFIKQMWGLVPQGVKPEYKERWEEVLRSTGPTWLRLKEEVSADWFGDIEYTGEYDEVFWRWFDFTKGKHISWQQALIILAVQKAVADKRLSRHFSITSGHGIGKSALASWLVLWFLYCFYGAQVPVTAPTSNQMHDVLWKELSIWISRMPEIPSTAYEWQSHHIRMRYAPEEWFARAKTSTKENTEALAGVHSDHVFMAVDEASGVPEQVYNTAEGALTSGNVYTFLISNPTRTTGYFYDTHHKNSADWQLFSFNCEQSPLVDRAYVTRQAKRHGVHSDEYGIRVKGRFPSEDSLDDSGYLQLISRDRINTAPPVGESTMIGRKILSIDPSGEGDDECEFVLRDAFRAYNIKTIQSTNDKEIAAFIVEYAEKYKLKGRDIAIEGLGVGMTVAKHVAVLTKGMLNIYVIHPATAPKQEERFNGEYFTRFQQELDKNDDDLFLNIRAVANWRMRNWLLSGGILIDPNYENSDWVEEISSVRYKRSMQGGKMQIMSKKEMHKLRIPSPNKSDALALGFLLDEPPRTSRQALNTQTKGFDPFAVL